jgi:hypothetical protein
MSDLINYADFDRIAEIFGFDDPDDPLWSQKEDAEDGNTEE